MSTQSDKAPHISDFPSDKGKVESYWPKMAKKYLESVPRLRVDFLVYDMNIISD